MDVCQLERAEPVWQLMSLNPSSLKRNEDATMGKVNRFRHRRETVMLNKPGLYRFDAKSAA